MSNDKQEIATKEQLDEYKNHQGMKLMYGDRYNIETGELLPEETPEEILLKLAKEGEIRLNIENHNRKILQEREKVEKHRLHQIKMKQQSKKKKR